MAKIYVSSTYQDLQEHRAQVEKVIKRMGHTDVAMEYYVAEDRRPVRKCLDDVDACDIYVGIYAWRYGWHSQRKTTQRKFPSPKWNIDSARKDGQAVFDFPA